MKAFLAGVVTTVVVLFVFRVPVGFPQVIDCRYTGGPPAVWMEIGSARKYGELVTFRAL
jgi:hypothetical protein